MIAFLLPLFKNSNPNNISYAILPVGVAMAACYYYAMTTQNPWLFLLGTFLGFIRMVVATLDGLVAVHYNKSSVLGDVLNRITPEICDLLLIPTLVLIKGVYPLGVFVLAIAWAVPFFGYFGAPSGLNVQSVGPVGQTDRLAALMIFSFLQFVGILAGWNIDFIYYFLVWIPVGGCITLILRFMRVYRDAKKKDLAVGGK